MNLSSITGEDFLASVIDAIPVPVFVVDEDVRVIVANVAAGDLVDDSTGSFLRMRGGDALRCINASRSPEGCGTSDACTGCVVRASVNDAVAGRKIVRKKARMELVRQGRVTPVHLLVTASPIKHGRSFYALLILEDIGELVELRSILPMCASCHKIRDDQDYWSSVESYFKQHLDVDISHGLCPDCIKRLYPDFALDEPF